MKLLLGDKTTNWSFTKFLDCYVVKIAGKIQINSDDLSSSHEFVDELLSKLFLLFIPQISFPFSSTQFCLRIY